MPQPVAHRDGCGRLLAESSRMAGKMSLSLENIDVPLLVKDVVETVGPMVRQNRNTLDVRCSPAVAVMRADPIMTRQILLNLLSNAARFTRDGTITLNISPRTIGDTASVEFIVTDTGVGMTPGQTAKIFDPFARAHLANAPENGGSGRLATVVHFCQLMSGRVSVVSTPGSGSRFTVQLPLAVIVPSNVAVP